MVATLTHGSRSTGGGRFRLSEKQQLLVTGWFGLKVLQGKT